MLLIPASIALGYLITFAFFPGVSKGTYLERDERRFYALGISVPAVLFGQFFVGQFAGINYVSLIVSYALIAALSYAIYRKRRVLPLVSREKKQDAQVKRPVKELPKRESSLASRYAPRKK